VTHILPHPLFKRDGDTIVLEREINFPDAALGCELKVPTLNGDALVEIPAGTQSGTVFRLKGRGLPRVDAYGRGDELVQVRIATPTKLTSKQKELLRELAQEFQGDDRARKGFLKR
jgi:molecular chaperone DnaJ